MRLFINHHTSGCPVQKDVVAIEMRLGLRVEDSLGLGILSKVKVADPTPPPENRDVDLLGGSGGGSLGGGGGAIF